MLKRVQYLVLAVFVTLSIKDMQSHWGEILLCGLGLGLAVFCFAESALPSFAFYLMGAALSVVSIGFGILTLNESKSRKSQRSQTVGCDDIEPQYYGELLGFGAVAFGAGLAAFCFAKHALPSWALHLLGVGVLALVLFMGFSTYYSAEKSKGVRQAFDESSL